MAEFDPARRLRDLTEASDRIGSNLLELESDPTVGLLDAADLCGETADRWRAARQTLAWLFTAHAALKETIDTAARLHGRSWLLSGARLDELRSLVDGPSVVASEQSLGPAERDLLAGSRKVVRRTPDDIIAEMAAGYGEVTAVVVAVAERWDGLVPRLGSDRRRCSDLAALAAELDVDAPELGSASEQLRRLAELLLSDPLAVDAARVDEVALVLDRIEEQLAELRCLHESWPDQVAAARALLADAHQVVADCDEAVSRASSRIALAEPLRAVTLPPGTADSLDRIVALPPVEGPAAAELVAWRREVARRVAEAHDLTARCRSLVDARDELRARLDAYAAKAAGLGLLEDADQAECYERARAALYTAPTDLAVAGGLVADYQDLVSAHDMAVEPAVRQAEWPAESQDDGRSPS